MSAELKTKSAKLETKKVGDIEGEFIIPSYQRGYRWGKGEESKDEAEKSMGEVERLLEDIYSFNGKGYYCLQPVVVKKVENKDDEFELIDGQQRLTTIYLIYRYMNKKDKSIGMPKFSISYKSRKKSKEFLEKIDLSKETEKEKDQNIDFWHFYTAYKTIRDWFNNFNNYEENLVFAKIDSLFKTQVEVIWYEVDSSENAIDMFTRLNIGKIPLTNAELVKAMFLSRDNSEELRRQEIAIQWDLIEKELHDDSFWYFLTNENESYYQTRIDLVLDIIAQTPPKNREKYYTFYKFNDMRQNEDLKDLSKIWFKIHQTYLELKSWYSDRDLYHKIGYLIASGSNTLQELYNYYSQEKTKTDFMKYLDGRIQESIKSNLNLKPDCTVTEEVLIDALYDLSYANGGDKKKIENILLLFNIESVRKISDKSQLFPFDKHKVRKDGKKVEWSLEHIHAQHSQSLRTVLAWKEWFELHIKAVKAIPGENKRALLKRMRKALKTLEDEKNGRIENYFDNIYKDVIDFCSSKSDTDPEHSISNLALLSHGDNSAIGNSVFDVKRDNIIEMDKEGRYIPLCTRRVFLKYYTPSEQNHQIYFWGPNDRKAYFDAICDTLKKYFKTRVQEDA